MRISLVTDTYLPEVNGVTTVLAALRAGLVARGHAVQVVAPRYGAASPDEAGIHRQVAVAMPAYPQARLGLPLPGAVGKTLRRFAPDVVHVITEGLIGAAGRRHARRHDLPLVTSYHTDFPSYAARYAGQWAVEPVRNYLRRFHGAAVLTQTPSEAARDELRGMGLSHAVVWGRGVDARHFTPARRSDDRRKARGAAGRLLVLHVSRLAVEKDVATLIEAFRLADEALGRSVMFVVAGDGPKAAEVRTALPFATHLGFLDRATLANLYADADLFVFPSPTETCGLVLLEAMASGVPVIASDRGGVRENLRPGLNGLQVRAGDGAGFAGAIVELVNAPGQREAMGQAARAFAVARDWERELDAIEPMYARAAARVVRSDTPDSHGAGIATALGAR